MFLSLALEEYEYFVNKVEKKILIKCARNMTYEYFEKGKIVFELDDFANKFYIILKGKVEVLLPKQKEDLDIEISRNIEIIEEKLKAKRLKNIEQTEKSKFPFGISNFDMKDDIELMHFYQNPKYKPYFYEVLDDVRSLNYSKTQNTGKLTFENIFYKEKLFKSGIFSYIFSKTLKEGEVFGELGLRRSKKRSATIICSENCDFAVLTKEQFSIILQQIEADKQIKLIRCFNQSFLKTISRDQLEKLSYNFTKMKFACGQTIFNTGDQANEYYLIKKGLVEILQTLTFEDLSKNISKHQKNQIKEKQFRLCQLTSGQFFGEEDLLNDSKRSYKAKAISNTTVYILTKNNFKRLIHDFPTVKEIILNSKRRNEERKASMVNEIFSLEEQKFQTSSKINLVNNVLPYVTPRISKVIKLVQENKSSKASNYLKLIAESLKINQRVLDEKKTFEAIKHLRMKDISFNHSIDYFTSFDTDNPLIELPSIQSKRKKCKQYEEMKHKNPINNSNVEYILVTKNENGDKDKIRNATSYQNTQISDKDDSIQITNLSKFLTHLRKVNKYPVDEKINTIQSNSDQLESSIINTSNYFSNNLKNPAAKRFINNDNNYFGIHNQKHPSFTETYRNSSMNKITIVNHLGQPKRYFAKSHRDSI